jgi:hypothetical protein
MLPRRGQKQLGPVREEGVRPHNARRTLVHHQVEAHDRVVPPAVIPGARTRPSCGYASSGFLLGGGPRIWPPAASKRSRTALFGSSGPFAAGLACDPA